ncbi:MAG: TRAFAC clade GTPase domain-containing protein, partial [Blastocatellia bacterium]
MRRLVCPYCFERFLSHRLAFRCINPDPSRCQPEEDRALAEYQRLVVAPKLPRVFTPEKQWLGVPISAVCKCGVKTSKMVCPRCHNDLPSQFGQTGSRTIALIGSKESGKSHYIAVLIHELTHRVGRDFKASLMALDDQTMKRYREDFESYLYKKREVIPGTLSARAQINVRYPLIYRFSRKVSKMLLFDGKQITSLVFFDTAGEDLENQDVMSTETK